MFRKKSFYLLAILLAAILVLTGCSSGGSDTPPGTDDDNSTAETVSISGEFSFPAASQETSLSSLNTGGEYEIVAENFDSEKPLENVDYVFNGENQYKVNGVETGLNIVVNIIRKKDNFKITAFIPEVTKDDENDETVGKANSASTILTTLVKKQKESGEVNLSRKEIDEMKAALEESTKDVDQDYLTKLIKDIEEDRVKQSDNITEIVKTIQEKIQAGEAKENAKQMVDFVRNAGLFVEDSASQQEKIINNNVEVLSADLNSFSTSFESEMNHLFTDEFLKVLPTNYNDATVDEYSLSNLDSNYQVYPEEVFSMEEWEWQIKDGEDTIIITTDYPSNNQNTEIRDLSKAEFNYTINQETDNKFFSGTVSFESNTTETNTINDSGYEYEIPVEGVVSVIGQYKIPNTENYADLNITIDENTALEANSGSQNVTITGSINIPDMFIFNGELNYLTAAEYNIDLNYEIEKFNYLELSANGTFEVQSPNVEDQLVINADNFAFNAEDSAGELKINYLDIKGNISDKSGNISWNGELNVQFNDYLEEPEVSKFDFKGIVKNGSYENDQENIDYAKELELELHPVFEYTDSGEIKSIASTIVLRRDNKYLEGEIVAGSGKLNVELKNENHSIFYFEGNIGEENINIVSEASYIVNANGQKIADIDESGRIYYLDDENGGEIGSIY